MRNCILCKSHNLARFPIKCTYWGFSRTLFSGCFIFHDFVKCYCQNFFSFCRSREISWKAKKLCPLDNFRCSCPARNKKILFNGDNSLFALLKREQELDTFTLKCGKICSSLPARSSNTVLIKFLYSRISSEIKLPVWVNEWRNE